MPFFGPMFSLIIPLPFLFYFSRLGIKEGLTEGIIILIAISALGKLIGEPALGFLCLGSAVAGLVLSELFKRQFSLGAVIFWGTACLFFMEALVLLLAGMQKNQGPGEMILGYFQSNLSEYIRIYESSGLDKDKISQIKQAFDLLSKVVARVYPALIIIGTGLVAWLNVALCKPLFRKGKINYPSFVDADKWCSPELLVWGVIAAGFTLFLPLTGIRFAAENILLVLFAIYVFHGLSILMFFFNKHRVPRWARAGMYVLIILQQLFLVLLAIAGLFDQWVDFRRLGKKINPETV